jgi:hypothetical protein
MTGVTGLLIKLGARFVVFCAVFFIAARRNKNIVIHNKWTTPLIGLAFAILDTALYWALAPILNLATLGAAGFIMPVIVNLVLLLGTVRLFKRFKWLEVNGVFATLWMALFLTLAHGALWLGLDYFPSR